MTRIGVLVSGGGTNLQALIDNEKAGKIPHGKICLVVASNDSGQPKREFLPRQSGGKTTPIRTRTTKHW